MISNSPKIFTAFPFWIASWRNGFYPFGRALWARRMKNARRKASLGRFISKNSAPPLAKASLARFSIARACPFLSSNQSETDRLSFVLPQFFTASWRRAFAFKPLLCQIIFFDFFQNIIHADSYFGHICGNLRQNVKYGAKKSHYYRTKEEH